MVASQVYGQAGNVDNVGRDTVQKDTHLGVATTLREIMTSGVKPLQMVTSGESRDEGMVACFLILYSQLFKEYP